MMNGSPTATRDDCYEALLEMGLEYFEDISEEEFIPLDINKLKRK